jgi:methylase of polypeptide subunit release factors
VASLWKQIEHGRIKPVLRRMRPYKRIDYAGLCVNYKSHLDGGGSTFGLEFVTLLRARSMPRQARIFEWCAGPGFIGFSLLAHGLCETLCLADINPEAVAACNRTVRQNKLEDRVTVRQSDNLDDIPAAERWDLVVSNPPHFADRSPGQLRYHDAGWKLHRRFFNSVDQFLKPGGVIVLQESQLGSTAETFRPMVEQAGFKIVSIQDSWPGRSPQAITYFLYIARAGDEPPSWAAR